MEKGLINNKELKFIVILFLIGSDDVIVRKLTNHTQTFGSTGGVAVCQREEVILSSGYDLDTGHAMINGVCVCVCVELE